VRLERSLGIGGDRRQCLRRVSRSLRDRGASDFLARISIRWRMDESDIPRRFARSPFAAVGWKKRRSYWSGLCDKVIWLDKSTCWLLGFSMLASEDAEDIMGREYKWMRENIGIKRDLYVLLVGECELYTYQVHSLVSPFHGKFRET
jgi:hypothetical protein